MGQPVTGDFLTWNGTKGEYSTPPPTDNRLTFFARKYNVDSATNIPTIPIAVTNTYIGLAPCAEAVTLQNWNVSKLAIGSTPTLTGMDGTTGIWTVPSTGYYLMRMLVFIRANNASTDEGINTGDFGDGSMSFAILGVGVDFTQCAIFNKQQTVLGAGSTPGMSSTSVGRTSFINFSQTEVFYLTSGAQYEFKILNNTELEYTPEPVGTVHQSIGWQVIKMD